MESERCNSKAIDLSAAGILKEFTCFIIFLSTTLRFIDYRKNLKVVLRNRFCFFIKASLNAMAVHMEFVMKVFLILLWKRLFRLLPGRIYILWNWKRLHT